MSETGLGEAGSEAAESAVVDAREAPPEEPKSALDLVVPLGATALIAAAMFVFTSPERTPIERLLVLGVPYLLLGVVAVFRLKQADALHLLKPRSGDLTFGALVAFLLYGTAFAFHALVTSPGEPHQAWVIRVYMLLGNALTDGVHLVAAAAALVGLLEELTWRGLVTPGLERRMGLLPANLLATLLFAAAHLPTVWTLSDPQVGPNPLLVLAALGCGGVWAYFRWRMERLPPVLLSHAVFTWAIVEFPLWR